MNTLSAVKPKVKAYYTGKMQEPGSSWIFVISGIPSTHCHMFSAFLRGVCDNYDDLITAIHDGKGEVDLDLKA